MSYTSPYLEIPCRTEAQALADHNAKRAFYRTRLVSRFVTNMGTEAKTTLWNPNHASIAEAYEVHPDDVEFSETEDGDEIVLVNGKEVGTLEVM